MSEGAPHEPHAMESRRTQADGRRYSPSAARNREPICRAFLAHMPNSGSILEIASGTGEHGIFISAAAPSLTWHFSDPDPAARASIAAWIRHAGRPALVGPHDIRADVPHWGEAIEALVFDGMVAINLLHIAPFATTLGLFAGASRRLRAGGRLFVYGAFARNGVLAESNAAFTRELQARDPAWGVRDLDRDVVPAAAREDFTLHAIVEMPYDNLCVVFEREAVSR